MSVPMATTAKVVLIGVEISTADSFVSARLTDVHHRLPSASVR